MCLKICLKIYLLLYKVVYAMYDAAAHTYDDEEFVSVKASSDKRLSELADIDIPTIFYHDNLS